MRDGSAAQHNAVLKLLQIHSASSAEPSSGEWGEHNNVWLALFAFVGTRQSRFCDAPRRAPVAETVIGQVQVYCFNGCSADGDIGVRIELGGMATDASQGLTLATRSSSSFFLIAYEFEEPLAALMSSSARHSATDFTLRKADSRVCNVFAKWSALAPFRSCQNNRYSRQWSGG